MTLRAVSSPAEPDTSWSAVLEASVENIGASPYIVWTEALANAGSLTLGPDAAGEHTSNCPAPGHEDAKPSLRWRQASDGQILFDCRAACEGQVILDALDLSYVQLKWARVEYVYRSAIRELVGVHVRKAGPGNTKQFWWEHVENGAQLNGRSTTWEPVLWCLPDLMQFADQAHLEGKNVHLWLAEGEKDAQNIADAFQLGWVEPEQQDSSWVHLVTTSADGAKSWGHELTEQVMSLGCAQISLVCDSDQAGTTRGTLILEALREATSTDLAIRAFNWLGQGIKDATEAIQTYGTRGTPRAIPTADADIYMWCSFETGWLSEEDALDVKGNSTGKHALHRTINAGRASQRVEAIARYPMRVDAVTVDVEGMPVGWEIDLGPGGRALLRTSDLDGSNLEKWNAKAGVFIIPTRQLTAALRAYLGFHGMNCGQMTVYDHEGWVDAERFVTKSGLLIGPEGESGAASLAGTEGRGGADWFYGLGDEPEAAQLLAKLLTFRDLSESGPVLAWLAAVAVRPRALVASGASFVPMLQVPGASGIGKTSFLRLATRLFGFSGNPISNVTSAGLVRTLALTTGVVWIDDFTDYDDTIRDIIRGGITGAGRTRGTTNSERGIVRDEAHASLINSGEHAFDANERAMSQRSVILEFAKSVQGRLDKESGEDQYRELELLGVARDDKGAGLSRWAGTTIRGLWAAAGKLDRAGLGTGTGNGVRGQAAWEFVRYGALCIGQWLRDCGHAEERVSMLESVVTHICEREAVNAARREKSGADVYLVQEIVPRYISWARQHMDSGISALVKELDLEEIKAAIRSSWHAAYGQGPGRAEQAGRAVVMLARKTHPTFAEVTEAEEEDGEKPIAVAVSAEALYQWASSIEGQRAGVGRDERHISASGIAMQLKQVANLKMRDVDKGTSDGCFRVALGKGLQVPRYRLITDPDVITWLCR